MKKKKEKYKIKRWFMQRKKRENGRNHCKLRQHREDVHKAREEMPEEKSGIKINRKRCELRNENIEVSKNLEKEQPCLTLRKQRQQEKVSQCGNKVIGLKEAEKIQQAIEPTFPDDGRVDPAKAGTHRRSPIEFLVATRRGRFPMKIDQQPMKRQKKIHWHKKRKKA